MRSWELWPLKVKPFTIKEVEALVGIPTRRIRKGLRLLEKVGAVQRAARSDLKRLHRAHNNTIFWELTDKFDRVREVGGAQ